MADQKFSTISQEQAASIFANAFKRHPSKRLPTPKQCYRFAISIGTVRDNVSFKRDFEKNLVEYRARLKTISAFKKLIERQKTACEGLDDALEVLAKLDVAVDRAAPDLMFPLGVISQGGKHKNSWWHRAAFYLCVKATDAWREAGNQGKISFDRGSPFIRVIVEALKLAGIVQSESAVSDALLEPNRLPGK